MGIIICLALIAFNSIYMVSRTGQSLGKRIMGLTMVNPIRDPHSNKPHVRLPSVGRLIWRTVAHVVDTFCLIGLIRLCFNDRRESFAYTAANTLVISKIDPEIPFVQFAGPADR